MTKDEKRAYNFRYYRRRKARGNCHYCGFGHKIALRKIGDMVICLNCREFHKAKDFDEKAANYLEIMLETAEPS